MVTLACHIGDDTIISYLVTLSVRTLGYKCMQDIVGQIGRDEELLRWFKNELVTSDTAGLSAVKPLKIEMEIVTNLMRVENAEKMARIITDSSIGIITDSKRKKNGEIIKASDKKTLERARRIYSERMNSALAVLSTSMPYEQADAQLKRLSDNFDPNNPAQAIAGSFVPAFSKIYHQDTMRRTSFNAVLAAIEICLSRIKTGKLPDELPVSLPKDLFSGKDFIYEKTGDGFILRCQGKDLDKGKIHEYEFKVRK